MYRMKRGLRKRRNWRVTGNKIDWKVNMLTGIGMRDTLKEQKEKGELGDSQEIHSQLPFYTEGR